MSESATKKHDNMQAIKRQTFINHLFHNLPDNYHHVFIQRLEIFCTAVNTQHSNSDEISNSFKEFCQQFSANANAIRLRLSQQRNIDEDKAKELFVKVTKSTMFNSDLDIEDIMSLTQGFETHDRSNFRNTMV